MMPLQMRYQIDYQLIMLFPMRSVPRYSAQYHLHLARVAHRYFGSLSRNDQRNYFDRDLTPYASTCRRQYKVSRNRHAFTGQRRWP